MSESAQAFPEFPPLDDSMSPRFEAGPVIQAFVQAWMEAAQGGRPPAIADYLRNVPGMHRPQVLGALEYIDGGNLAQLIDGEPHDFRKSAEMVELLAQAIQFAHDHGVIHRDLKPANVLLTRGGTPKITDFGLAKRVESDSSQTRTGTLMGTPS